MSTQIGQKTTLVEKRSNRIDVIMLGVTLLALGILILLLTRIVPAAFTLQFNGYAIISMVGFFLYLALSIMLARRPNHSASMLWLALFLAFGTIWSGAEIFERMATTPVGAIFWGDIIAGVVIFLPACFYLFVLYYTNRKRTPIPFWVPSSILSAAATMSFLFSGDNVYGVPAFTDRLPWGYPEPTGIVSILFITWAAVLTSASIARLYGFYRSSTSSQDRNQAMIFMASAGVLFSISGFSEVVMPALGIVWFPPLGTLGNSLLALGVIMGIYKYGSISVGVEEIADAVLTTMAGGVVVTDVNYTILYTNYRADELLEGLDNKRIGSDLEVAFGKALDVPRAKWEADLGMYGSSEIEDSFIGRSGSEMILRFRVTRLEATLDGYIFVISDITEFKRVDNALKEQASKLEAANKAYQNSQTAMINLLEDARELETELKSEKESIEQKIAERTRELRTQRESLDAIINSVDFGIYMLGPDLHTTLVNTAMQDLYEIIMEKKYTLKGFDKDFAGYEIAKEDIKQALATRRPVVRPEYPRGSRLIRSFRSPLYEQGSNPPKLLGMVNVLQDITEAKAVERSRDEFFSIASHELRTPLTAIRGNTAMIQQYFADQIKDPTLKEMIGDIHNSSIRLITLVNDFLNTSRLEQGKIEFKIAPFPLNSLITEVIKEFKAGDVESKVPVEAELSAVPDTLADRDRLKEVVINLIGNAVKFTDTGRVTVRLSEVDGRIKLSVEDTGSGIPAESQNLLFRKFQQASNNILTRDSTRSSGLGLYISKMIVTGMGGEIYLEKSAVNKGSIFTVMLPLATPTQPKQPTKPAPSKPVRKKATP